MTDTDDEAATGIDDSAALSDAVADEHATALAEAAAISSIGASSTRTRRDAPRRGPYHLALSTTAPPYASPAGPLATYRAGVAK
ncbi:hypothetical protein I0Q12_24555 [Rhodococcus sp. CX]|uniref:hypothetical protein n=1 Tax=Rhodococcus sp. CX TaxID=2789880 RepID=UPI0018CF3032|nr:hypothetical protein [Rhodococcus sp. CX]MBH0122497.1 hypothetical protein [Rhodococcus sp. CX]